MRFIFLAAGLLLASCLPAQTDTTTQQIKSGVINNGRIVLRCSTTKPQHQPLYIVDGVPVQPGDLAALHPGDIERVSILKDSCNNFCSRSANGVIVVTTKQLADTFLKIVDADDGAPIAGAVVSYTVGETQLRIATNDSGLVQLRKRPAIAVPQLKVVCLSYENTVFVLQRQKPGQQQVVRLHKKMKQMDRVTITGCPTIRCGKCSIRCISVRCSDSNLTTAKKNPESRSLPETPAIWPNPTRGGTQIFIRSTGRGNNLIRLLNAAGQQISRQSINRDNAIIACAIPMVPAGVYFVRITAVGNRVTTHRLIIQ